ncbi:hypothetical protein [Nocardioides convexus]|uniref:hypothetical protein n=1 Tax=Nocardioides convexus TaxID=2712224 RepID=UPI0024181AFB|nr:hypothetical protein [Nocardioides convexus]
MRSCPPRASTGAAPPATPTSGWRRSAPPPRCPRRSLPTRVSHGDGPPAPRAWADKDPVAARRLELARAAVGELAEEHQVPLENLLTPDTLRRTMWTPPSTREPVESAGGGHRPACTPWARAGWQVGLTAPALSRAILEAEQTAKRQSRLRSSVAEPEGDTEPEGDAEPEGVAEPDGDSEGS